MQRTRMARAGEASRVGGFRLFGQGRIFSFDSLLGSPIDWQQDEHRGEHRRVQALSAPTVSAVHATVALDASVRDKTAPVFLLRDCESKNGIEASTRGLRGPFARVRAVQLTLGMHVRLGAVGGMVTAQRALLSTGPRFEAGAVLVHAAYYFSCPTTSDRVDLVWWCAKTNYQEM